MLVVLGYLSRKLGGVTHARPYYAGFFLAALLVVLSVSIRFLRLVSTTVVSDMAQWGVLYNGLFAAGVTLGVFVAWRYWSWLLAERS
jgi:uncharacterized membrane protein